VKTDKPNRNQSESSTDVGLWEWDVVEDKISLSPELRNIIGVTKREMPSLEEMLDLVHPDDRDSVRGHLESALARDRSFHMDHRLCRADGQVIHLRVFGVVQRGEDGSPVHVIGLAQDATSAVNNEAALRLNEHRVRSILNTTVDAIITIDERGIIETYNRAAERIFGYEAEEVIGRPINLLMPSPYREEHDSYIRNYVETGDAKIIGIGREVKGQRRDGSSFPLELAVSEVRLEDRRIFTGVIKDVSDRRRLEKEILRISEQEQRRIGQDLHDGLGQMLTGIGLLSQHLARQLVGIDKDAAEQAQEITSLIREADQQARALARGLVPVDIEAEGLATALKRLSRNAETLFGISCVVRTIGSPSAIDASAVTHLFRIAQEAVSNAVKHGRATEVSVALAFAPDRIRLRVRDNGIGFPSERSGESGMGVHIMHYRARIIGGTLEIRSISGEGTSVTCTVPLVVRNSRD